MPKPLTPPVVRFPEGQPAVFCRPCGVFHEFHLGPSENVHGHCWIWNGDRYKPTFWPAVYTKVARRLGLPDESDIVICHAEVKDGRIIYYQDSTHELSGQTVDLAPPP